MRRRGHRRFPAGERERAGRTEEKKATESKLAAEEAGHVDSLKSARFQPILELTSPNRKIGTINERERESDSWHVRMCRALEDFGTAYDRLSSVRYDRLKLNWWRQRPKPKPQSSPKAANRRGAMLGWFGFGFGATKQVLFRDKR